MVIAFWILFALIFGDQFEQSKEWSAINGTDRDVENIWTKQWGAVSKCDTCFMTYFTDGDGL